MTEATTMESSLSAACITWNKAIQKIARTPRSNLVLLFSSYLHPLSNFYYSEFTIGEYTFTSVEQYFQWQKAIAFGDQEIADKIRALRYRPDEAKRLGRMVRGFCKVRWGYVRESVMRQGLLAKFGQNPYLALKLRMSRGHMIAEASPWDREWGIGLGVHDSDSTNPQRWLGKNLLGKALMRVREDIKNFPAFHSRPPPSYGPALVTLNPRVYPLLEAKSTSALDQVDCVNV